MVEDLNQFPKNADLAQTVKGPIARSVILKEGKCRHRIACPKLEVLLKIVEAILVHRLIKEVS